MKILVGCEMSGVVRDSFLARGHDAVSCDLLPSERPGPHIQGDIFSVINDGWDMALFFPPCTYLCVSGNRWFKAEYRAKFPTREQDRVEAIDFFLALANCNIPKICIENPVGIMSKIYRKPDQIIQPFMFGHTEAKKTCLWLKNLPKLQPTNIVEPEYQLLHNGKRIDKKYSNCPKKDRGLLRSRTFQGIADAFAETWG